VVFVVDTFPHIECQICSSSHPWKIRFLGQGVHISLLFFKGSETMFEIKNNVIKMTRGDSASLNVNLKKADGSEYIMQEGDTLTMTVRKVIGSSILMQIVSHTKTIYISPSDSKNLLVGSCVYDIELKTASQDVFTVVGLGENVTKNMVVCAEVTE
jgi:hypothetical protein